MNKYNIKSPRLSWFLVILSFLMLISSCKDESQKIKQEDEFISKKIVLNKPVVQKKDIKSKDNNSQLKKDELKTGQVDSDVKEQKSGEIIPGKKSADILAPEPFYDPYTKADPFAPLFKKKKIISTIKKKRRVALTPLEKTDLSQLKLTGIIQSRMGNKALVEEASGKGYVVTKDTYIGIHGGKVSKIFRDRIIVEEEEEDLYGKLVIKKRELKLQKPPGEQ